MNLPVYRGGKRADGQERGRGADGQGRGRGGDRKLIISILG